MKKIKFKILGFIIGIIISVVVVYASTSYKSIDVFYNNSNSTLSSADVQSAIDELAVKYSKIKSKNSECPDGYKCLEKKDTLSLGDYVSYTPTITSYTTDASMTGYTSTQTINPSELNLWRVLKIYDDGSVDLISEYVSSTSVYFRGQTGYQNLVGYLNVLASQYENDTYTQGSRYFGYNGQTEYITDTSMFTNPAPWTSSTGSSTVESQGGGDTLYTTDYNQLTTAGISKVAYKANATTTTATYWVASRYYYYYSATKYYWRGRYFSIASGSLGSGILYDYYSSSFDTYSSSNALRPVVTLKSGLKYSGFGTDWYPMKISAN
jgi:hypothetical protein